MTECGATEGRLMGARLPGARRPGPGGTADATTHGTIVQTLAAIGIGLAVLVGAADVATATMPELGTRPGAEVDPRLGGLTVLTQFAEFGQPEYPPDFTRFGYVNPDAPQGGAITLGAFGTFERLDTIVLGGRWAAGIGLTTNTLMTGSGDELSSYYPLIAEYVAIPDDLSHAVFKIHPEATFADGHPITAEDFVYSFENLKTNARPLLKEFYADVTGAEALDTDLLRFDFATTDNWRTLSLAAGFSPEPKHFWEESGRDIGESYLEPTVASGAYEITDVDPGRSITYTKVEDYWAEDRPVNVGANNIGRIRYVYYRDLDVMFQAFLGGEFDFWQENSSQRWATGYDVQTVQNGTILRDTVPDGTPQGFRGFVFNTRLPKFYDRRVREAIGTLFDYEWTRTNVQYGFYERATSYFPNSDYGISEAPLPEGEELAYLEPHRDQLPDHVFQQPFQVPSTDGSGNIRRQLRTALGLFREAGWVIEGERLINAETGQQMTLEILLSSNGLLRVVQPFITNMKRAGIEATVRIVDTAQYERRTDDFDFDMIYLGANFFPPPGPELRTYFLSAAADEPGSANWPGIRNPVVDALLQDIIDADTLDGKKAATRALDRVLLWEHYIIPSYFNDEFWIAHRNRFGRPARNPEYSTGFPTTWWIDPELDAALAD